MAETGMMWLGDVEIVNAARLKAYIDWATASGCLTNNCGGGIRFIHPPSPLYENDPFSVPRWGPRAFDSPLADPAPWWSASRSESSEFLGVWVEEATGFDGSPYSRSAIQLPQRGAALTRGRSTGRTMSFTVLLVACSEQGMEYGMGWLDHALGALCGCGVPGCSPCQESTLVVRTTPPVAGSPNIGVWELRSVGLMIGATWEPLDDEMNGCLIRRANFTLVAANPCRYQWEEVLVDWTPLATVGAGCMDFEVWHCANVVGGCVVPPAPGPVGVTSVNYHLRFNADRCGYYALKGAYDPGGAGCAGLAGLDVCSQMFVGHPGVGGELNVQAGERRVYYRPGPTAAWEDGSRFIVHEEGQRATWLEFHGTGGFVAWVESPWSSSPEGVEVRVTSQYREGCV